MAYRRLAAVVVASVAICAGLFVTHPWALFSSRSEPNGPLVSGNVSYIMTSGTGSAVISSQSTNINGTVEAYMTNASFIDSHMNGSGVPVLKRNSTAFLGMHALAPNGSFSFNLNRSFYSLNNGWKSYFNKSHGSEARVPVMFEILFSVSNATSTDIYTEAYPVTYSPFNSPAEFSINHVFNLGKPQIITANNNSSAATAYGGASPSDCVLEQSTYWNVVKSTSLSDIHFPLVAMDNATPLSLGNGDLILAATFGFSKISISFSSAQAFGSKSLNASNMHGWSFTSSTTRTASSDPSNTIDWNAPKTQQYPAARTNGTWNVSYIYLNNVPLQINVLQLVMEQKLVCGGQVTWTCVTDENDWQLQDYVQPPSNGYFSIGGGYLPGDFASALAQLTGDSSGYKGILNYGQQVNFTSVWSSLEAGTNTELSSITGLLSTAIAGVGIAVAAAAALAIPPGGGKIATAALIAEIYSIVGFASSAAALLSSVMISAQSESYAELASVTSFYTLPVNASVIMNPSVLQIEGISVNVTSPLVTLT